jgi:imidazolonepropionase-like amidohydrolase
MFIGFEGDEIRYVGNSKPQENYEIILEQEEAKQNHSIFVTPSFIDPHSHIGMVRSGEPSSGISCILSIPISFIKNFLCC